MAHKREVVLNLEVVKQIDQLVDEQIDCPEGRGLVLQVGRFGVAELIIQDDWDIVFGSEISEWDEIVVAQTGPPMKNNHGSALPVFQVAEVLEVGLVRLILINKIDLSVYEFRAFRRHAKL